MRMRIVAVFTSLLVMGAYAQVAPPTPPAAVDPVAASARAATDQTSKMKAAIGLLNDEKNAAENRAITLSQENDRLQAEVDAVNGQLNQAIAKQQALQKELGSLKAPPAPPIAAGATPDVHAVVPIPPLPPGVKPIAPEKTP